MSDVFAVVTAAGRSRRMEGVDKLTLPLLGRPLLMQTLAPFLNWNRLGGLVLAVSPGREEEFHTMVMEHFGTAAEKVKVVTGGAERQESIRLSLERLASDFHPSEQACVLIHDGARPLVTEELFHTLLEGLEQFQGVIPATPVRDTIKRVRANAVLTTEDRDTLRMVQTPQAFRFAAALQCHRQARAEGFLGTDDASLFERYQRPVGWVEGPAHNLKVTVAEDIPLLSELAKRAGLTR